jgi:hypothetical protein
MNIFRFFHIKNVQNSKKIQIKNQILKISDFNKMFRFFLKKINFEKISKKKQKKKEKEKKGEVPHGPRPS